MAPAAVVREPPMVPVPERVAFAATVTGEVPKVPSRASEPVLMAVAPEWVLFPVRVRVPVPVLVRAVAACPPLVILPAKVVEVPSAPTT
jgi:hypothetical protein